MAVQAEQEHQDKEIMVEHLLAEGLVAAGQVVWALVELGQTAGMAEQERHPQFLGHLFAEAVAVVAVRLLERPAQQLAAEVLEVLIQFQQLMPLQILAAVVVEVWGLVLGHAMAVLAAQVSSSCLTLALRGSLVALLPLQVATQSTPSHHHQHWLVTWLETILQTETTGRRTTSAQLLA